MYLTLSGGSEGTAGAESASPSEPCPGRTAGGGVATTTGGGAVATGAGTLPNSNRLRRPASPADRGASSRARATRGIGRASGPEPDGWPTSGRLPAGHSHQVVRTAITTPSAVTSTVSRRLSVLREGIGVRASV